ncbi:hypothetical protein Tco_1355470 [Tanacetum coccineum]
MLNTRNETLILERPFLATIHTEIDVFNKEIYLGIRDDRVTFDMDKKIHNFTTPIGKVYMVNSIHNDESSTSTNVPSDNSSQFNKSNNLHHENNNDMQERSGKKARMIKLDTNTPSAHFCKPVKKNLQWDTSLLRIRWSRVDLLPLSFEMQSNAQGSLSF